MSELIRVPDIGNGDGEVIELLVKVGDRIEAEQSLLTLESDKASMEIPAPRAGVITRLLVKLGDKLKTGDNLLELDSGEAAAAPAAEPAPAAAATAEPAAEPVKAAAAAPAASALQDIQVPDIGSSGKARIIELLVKVGDTVEAEQSLLVLESDKASMEIPSPTAGVVTALHVKLEDEVGTGDPILQLQTSAAAPAAGTMGGSGIPPVPEVDFSKFGEVEEVAMTRLMQVGAANLHRSWLNVPHVTQFDNADISELEAFRIAQKSTAEKAGVKLTVLPFLLKACAHLLLELPDFNSSLAPSGKALIRKKYVNIGFAVDTPDGLLVPVLKDVDKKSLLQLAAEAAELAEKARTKKLLPDAMQGACFTISSLGHIGGTGFTPIVNAPEVAILGVSKASMQPVWDGKTFQPHLLLPLSLSYDHRVINGAAAARFTRRLGELLGDIRTLLL